MNDNQPTDTNTNTNTDTDLQRASEWLSGETQIRVSRKILVAGGILLLVLLGIAID